MSGPGAEVQNTPLVREPCTDLLQQPSGSPFHDGVEERLHNKPATVVGSQPASRSSLVSRSILGQ